MTERQALAYIWKIVARAELAGKKLTKEQMIGIMIACANALKVDPLKREAGQK